MRKYYWITTIVLFLAVLACAGIANARYGATRPQPPRVSSHKVLPMEDSAWHNAVPGMPPGSRFASISGDPSQPAPFTIRVELPPGYRLPPYSRPADENIIVLAGTIEVGSGSRFDEHVMTRLPSGSFVQLRANETHFAMTKLGATIQIFGMGPFVMNEND